MSDQQKLEALIAQMSAETREKAQKDKNDAIIKFDAQPRPGLDD